MSAVSPPYVLASASHSAELFRNAYQARLSQGGVVGATDLVVKQMTTPAMKVQVTEGQIEVAGSLGSTGPFPSGLTQQGTYYDYNNATDDQTIAAADPTNPRIDAVVYSIQDSEYAGSNNQPVIQVVTGTPAPTPSPPSTPASSVVLGHVRVPANATSIVTADITDERTFSAILNPLRGVPGGILVPTVQTIIAKTTATQIVSLSVTGSLYGGMTVATNSFVCPVPGLYEVNVNMTWQNGGGGVAAGLYESLLYKNGSEVRILGGETLTATGFAITPGSTEVVCAAGDKLSLYGFQSSAASQATFADGKHVSFSVSLRSQ